MSKADDEYINFPETYSRRRLNALYREISLKDTVSRALRKYFNAMANLYGIIPLKKAYEIISGQNRRLVTEAEFYAFAEIAVHENEGYCILGSDSLYIDQKNTPLAEYEIIDMDILCEDDFMTAYEALSKGQYGKPFYVPKKDILLSYANPNYCQPTLQFYALQNYLSNKSHKRPLDAETTAGVMADILFEVRCRRGNLDAVIGILGEADIKFENDEQIIEFAEIYQNFANNTRVQWNRGYTPNEMFTAYSRKL